MKKSILILAAIACIGCTKNEAFNYNINLKRNTYTNDIIHSTGWQGHALTFKEQPTKEQLIILGFGSAIDAENKLNNGKGFDAQKYPSKIVAVEIKTVGYDYSPIESIEEHAAYKKGLEYMSLYPQKWNEFKQIITIK